MSPIGQITKSQKRSWPLPAVIAFFSLLGGLSGNLAAGSIQSGLQPYRRWVWLVFIVSAAVTVVAAIRDHLLKAAETDAPKAEATGDHHAAQDHTPADLTAFRLARIAEWSQPIYALEKRFVNLTLLLDQGEEAQERWQPEDFRFDDLREVLKRRKDDAAIVLLGNPGSGKSTLLRHLQLVHSQDCLRNGKDEVSFFIQLNTYHGEPPREWLLSEWVKRYPRLPRLENYLAQGRALLLLDALNEMQPPSGTTYHQLVGRWREFVQEARANTIVFSCRSLAYSASLGRAPELTVPQVNVQPMTVGQLHAFVLAYAPTHAQRIRAELENNAGLSEFYRTPYFLKLLCELVEPTGKVPKGRAELFTRFMRKLLARETQKNPKFSQPDELLTERDHSRLTRRDWDGPFDLPDDGLLLRKLSGLAFDMQQSGRLNGNQTESAQVVIGYHDARGRLAHQQAEAILKAGVDLNVLDEEQNKIKFFHQLLQEYFAARGLARESNPALVQALVHVE